MSHARMLITLVVVAGCAQASGETRKPREDVVATVNGAPVTQLDVRLRLKNVGHKEAQKAAPSKDQLGNVLETVIGEELAAQRAAELGLDADPKYQEGLRQIEAQLAAYRRKGLSDLFWEKSVDKAVEPSEAEARTFFDENQKQIRTQLHVLQILRRGEAQIEEVERELAAGKSFEDVAATLFPNRPPGVTPWDMGWMSWYKLPDQWRKLAYELKPGEISGVIRGPKERFWIIQVVDRKEDPDVSFEAAKAAVIGDLKRGRVEAAREKARKDLREKARIQHVSAPTLPPHPPVED